VSRSQDKLELVKGEIRGIDRSLDVKVLPIDLANVKKERFA
jgi:short-subunit dehydrogenase